MEYCNGRLCISTRELFDGGIVTESNYHNWKNRNRVDVVQRGGGARGSYALIAIDSLPQKILDKIDFESISPFEEWVKKNYTLNQQALGFYIDSHLCGKKIRCSKALSLAIDASLLDMLIKITSSRRISYAVFGGEVNWDTVCGFLTANRSKYGHNLPSSSFRLRKKLQEYQHSGFSSLISGKFGNQNAKK